MGLSDAHAVVLVGCGPNYLKFMNSWGQNWGDGGFFRIKDAKVLPCMEFYDVCCNILDSEIETFKMRNACEVTEYLKDIESISQQIYRCPKCHRTSKIKDYTGHLLKACCPLCHQSFEPAGEGIMKSLYLAEDLAHQH